MYYEAEDGNLCVCGFFYMVLFEDHENWKMLLRTNQVDFEFKLQEGSSMKEVAQWCEDNLQEGWAVGNIRSGFYSKEDAVAFKLRWL